MTTSLENTRLDKMERKLNDVEAKVNTVEAKVDKILVALTGDELTTSDGLVNEVKILRDRLLQLESWKNRAMWMIAGAGVSGGIGLTQVFKFLLDIFSK